MKYYFLYIMSLLFFLGNAQEDKVNKIEEVVLYVPFSSSFQLSDTGLSISDSIIRKNDANLKTLLNKYNNLYIKEYGNAMLASISFRGASASHTAVYWNGIPVNSVLNGQVDFNNISGNMYNQIQIHRGGASVILGSAAIGGAIDLQNRINYTDKSKTHILAGVRFGSYNTYSSDVNVNYVSKRFSTGFAASLLGADNNYPYYNTNLTNENAEVKQQNYQFNLGYKLNKYHRFYLKLAYNDSNRNTSGTLAIHSDANLQYDTNYNLLGWKSHYDKFTGELKLAYTTEKYHYIHDKHSPDYFSENKSKKYFLQYESSYRLSPNTQFQIGLSTQAVKARGSDILTKTLNRQALYISLNKTFKKKFLTNISLRKERSSVFKIPFVFGVNTKQKWTKFGSSILNFSTNFRTPTINDLYWKPGGNPQLHSEHNWSSEIGYQWHFNKFQKSKWNATLLLFYSESKDLIQWQPQSNAIWSPVNIANSSSKGIELLADVNYIINPSNSVFMKPQYTFVKAIDSKNNTELMYVPKHTASVLISFAHKDKYWIDYTWKYTGNVYTDLLNKEVLSDYTISDISIHYNLMDRFTTSFFAQNIFNAKYQIVQQRPMPMRNYSVSLKYEL